MENNKNDVLKDVELSPNEKLWKEFTKGFWGLFVAHILLTGAARSFQDQSASFSTSITFLILQIIVAFLMVWHVGKYSYIFSKNKKHSILQSLLGFIWFGLIGIFISYYAVQRDYHIVIGKVVSKTNKALRLFLIIIGAAVALGVPASIILSALNLKHSSEVNTTANEISTNWVRVVSPDGNISLDFPKDWQFNPEDSDSNTIPTYSWTSSSDANEVLYVIKYEDYSSVIDREHLNLTNRQNLLKKWADSQIENFTASNISTQFIKINGRDAIKYKGLYSKDGDTFNIEGNIIDLGKSFLSIISLYKDETKNDISRILNSLIIK